MKVKRVLFADGSNLYGGLTELLGPGEFVDFADLLALIEIETPVDEVRFYGTYMRTDPAKPRSHDVLVQAQKAFFDSVKAIEKATFYKGHFSASSGKEKGIDVRLAVDMALGACLDEFDEAIIITGDADLWYAVQRVRLFEKPVHLVTLTTRVPYRFMSIVTTKRLYGYGEMKELNNPALLNARITDMEGSVGIRSVFDTKTPAGDRRGSDQIKPRVKDSVKNRRH